MTDKPIQLWDMINSIMYGTEEVFDESVYNPFVVTLALGQHQDLVLIAQEVNQRPNLTKRQHYDFLFNLIRKKKRFSPWQKRIEEPKIKLMQEAFGFSYQKALDALQILTPDDLKNIENRLKHCKGGLQNAK